MNDALGAVEAACAGWYGEGWPDCPEVVKEPVRERMLAAICAYLDCLKRCPPDGPVTMLMKWENMLNEEAESLWRHAIDEVLGDMREGHPQ